MPNPDPVQTNEFLEQQFKPQGEVEGVLSKKAIAVKLPVEVDKFVRSLSNTAAWLRRVITNAAQEELMQPKTTESELMELEDRDWLESDLSSLGKFELYEWGDIDPLSLGKPIHYERGRGFVVEGGKDSE